MDHLIFTAYSGMNGSMVRQRVIASNMANAQTIGFRAETLTATPVTLKVGPNGAPALEARAMTDGEVHGASMAEQAPRRTADRVPSRPHAEAAPRHGGAGAGARLTGGQAGPALPGRSAGLSADA